MFISISSVVKIAKEGISKTDFYSTWYKINVFLSEVTQIYIELESNRKTHKFQTAQITYSAVEKNHGIWGFVYHILDLRSLHLLKGGDGEICVKISFYEIKIFWEIFSIMSLLSDERKK